VLDAGHDGTTVTRFKAAESNGRIADEVAEWLVCVDEISDAAEGISAQHPEWPRFEAGN
jgi:hypothetical protein